MKFKIHYWPGLTFGLHIFTFLLTYAIAVSIKHVYAFFPYISDSGTTIPESCIFGQLMNFGALSLGITLYIRYRQVNFGIDSGHINIAKKLNNLTLWLAYIMSLGISIVANFQETAILIVHLLGAFMTFGCGTVYFSIQTKISYATVRKPNSTKPDYGIGRNMLFFRIFLSCSLFPLLLINGICGLIALHGIEAKTMAYWPKGRDHFEVRLTSTISEWILVIFFFIYILTFTNEFKALKFKGITFSSKVENLNEAQEFALQLAKA